jgi:hypothetical protein
VDCLDIRQRLVTGDIVSGALEDAHVRGCQQCADLLADRAALGRRLASATPALALDSSAQLDATEALLAKEHGLRAYLRSRSTRARWALTLTLPTLLVARELFRRRIPVREVGVPKLIAALVLLGILGLALHSALRPLPIERRAARLRSALSVVAWCLPFALWLVPEAHASAEELSSGFAGRSLACFAYGSALGAPCLALLWALDRGKCVPFRVWALAAGCVALVANVILVLHCPLTDGAHLLAGHFSIGLVWFAAVSSAEWRSRRAV